MIEPPRHDGEYNDAHIDCQAALESALVALIDDAQASGWSLAQITTSIIDLADAIMLQSTSMIELVPLLTKLRKRKP